MTPLQPSGPPASVRPHEEVSAVLALSDTDELFRGRYGRGVLGALRWAVGGQVAAPITASAPLDSGRPCAVRMLEELQAAHGELLGHTGRTVQLDFARGVYEALAWVCGSRDRPPGRG